MKKINVVAVPLFAVALIAGAFLAIGGGVSAQTASPSPAALACSVSAQTVAAGTAVTLTASGGTGSYVWSSPGLVITNPNGQRFTVTFNAAGTYPVTVTSGSQTATCNVVVTAAEAPDPGTAPVAPGLPNTGELE